MTQNKKNKRIFTFVDAEDSFHEVRTISYLVFCVLTKNEPKKNFIISRKLKNYWIPKTRDSKSFMNPKKD